jgi:hypothetical protein
LSEESVQSLSNGISSTRDRLISQLGIVENMKRNYELKFRRKADRYAALVNFYGESTALEDLTEAEVDAVYKHRDANSKEHRQAYRRQLRAARKEVAKTRRNLAALLDQLSNGGLPEGRIKFFSNGQYDVTQEQRDRKYRLTDEELKEYKDTKLRRGTEYDLNNPADLEKFYQEVQSALSYGVHGYGAQGSLEIHTAVAAFPKLLQQIRDNPGGGVVFRRGAGLSYAYDKQYIGKEGLRMLGKDFVIGNYESGSTTYDGDVAGVILDDDFNEKWGIEAGGHPLYSRRGVEDTRDRRILKKIGAESPLKRLGVAAKTPGQLAKVKDYLIQSYFDSGLPFKRMVEQVAPDIPGDENPYVAWRLLAGDGAIIEDWLGIVKKTEGTVPFNIGDRLAGNWGVSLRSILEPIFASRQKLEDFTEYVVARRANELMVAGKENLFTDEEIEYGLSFETPEFMAVAAKVYAYNDSLLQYSVDGGFMSPEVAAKFRRYSFYIPFMREAEYEGDVGGRGNPFKRLKGGKQNIRDPWQNIIDNTASIIHATNRNAAMLRALHLAESRRDGKRWLERVPVPKAAVHLSTKRILDQLAQDGIQMDIPSANELSYMQTFFQNKPIGDEKNRIIIIKEAGLPVAIKVHDQTVWRSLHAMAPMEFGLLTDFLSIPAETVRTGIVMDPGFMGANFSRDTLSGFIQSQMGVTLTPVVSSAAGMMDVVTGAERYKLYRALGGAFADIWHGDSKETHHTIKRLTKAGGFHPLSVVNPASYWRTLRRIGTVTESGTRFKAFDKMLDLAPTDPGHALLSALEGREVSVDFGLHGVSKTMRVLERITPFLNPAKQGLYKMNRTIIDQPLTTLMRGSPLVLLTFYLWMLNKDEDWYKDIENWEKNHYWHADIGLRYDTDDEKDIVIPLRVPKPFEYGALFGSFPEALFQYLHDDKGEDALWRAASTIEDVFMLRAAPPALLLPVEMWANRSSFTERPIVPGYLQGIDPKYQYSAGTSSISRDLGKLTGIAPVRQDYIVRSIFGTLGMYALMAVDDPYAQLTGKERKPARHWWQQQGLRRFFSDPLRPGGKAMTEFYDVLREYQIEQKTMKFLDYSQEYIDSLDNLDSFGVMTETQLGELMGSIRKANRSIRDSSDFTRAEKQEMIDSNSRKLRLISTEWKKAKEKAK